MNDFPELDVDRIAAAYEARVRAVLHGEFPAALHLAERLDPQRWALEWSLPAWLGDAFGLDPEVAREICLSNVLGLASVRLSDDVEDGEVPGTLGSLPTVEVSGRLYSEALGVYRQLFDAASEFWTQLDLRMREWRAATAAATAGAVTADDACAGDVSQRLPQMRGAPLKISAFAVCLLTGHRTQFDTLARCLDHALTGMVLYDSVIDWREDLAAGRWNGFVEAAGRAARPRDIGHVRSSDVEVALLTTDVAAIQFREIVEDLRRAAAMASGLGIRGLNSHLGHVALRLDGEGKAMAARYSEIGARAQQIMFGKQPPLAA